MPLVIVCGFPCSGKTRISEELKGYLSKHSKDVHIVSDHDHYPNRDIAYEDSNNEKELRSSLKATVERLLSKESIIILDSLNYIKGYRYELYCVAKHNRTQHCVIYCMTSVDKCREWNRVREPLQRYSDEVFDGLVMRFEEPDSRNRWDSPLFTLTADDQLPLEKVREALFERNPLKPNQSTQSQPLLSGKFLYSMDRVTQDVISAILESQRVHGVGQPVAVAHSDEIFRSMRPVTMAELRRYRKQFITYTKMHPVEETEGLTSLFVQYLNNCLQIT